MALRKPSKSRKPSKPKKPKQPHVPMTRRFPDHPSGRPIHYTRTVGANWFRDPPDEPLTPGLRPGTQKTEAIGFIAHDAIDYEGDDEYDCSK
jgi:hypothetical protein